MIVESNANDSQKIKAKTAFIFGYTAICTTFAADL
jgi:hypothetical protein